MCDTWWYTPVWDSTTYGDYDGVQCHDLCGQAGCGYGNDDYWCWDCVAGHGFGHGDDYYVCVPCDDTQLDANLFCPVTSDGGNDGGDGSDDGVINDDDFGLSPYAASAEEMVAAPFPDATKDWSQTHTTPV